MAIENNVKFAELVISLLKVVVWPGVKLNNRSYIIQFKVKAVA